MNDDPRLERTGEPHTTTSATGDGLMTDEEFDDTLNFFADLLATAGLSDRDYWFLSGLHHAVAVEATENRRPLPPEEQAEVNAEAGELMDRVEELMNARPGGRSPQSAVCLRGCDSG